MTIEQLTQLQQERQDRAKRLNAASDRAMRISNRNTRLLTLLETVGGRAKFPTTGSALLRHAYRRGELALRLNYLAIATFAGVR